MYPDRLGKTLEVCDWVGMDVKGPFKDYPKVTQVENSGALAERSLKLLLASGVDYEIRTTVHPTLLSQADILEMAGVLGGLGVRNFVLQRFQPKGCSDQALLPSRVSASAGISGEIISEDLKGRLHSMFRSFKIRNG